MINQRAVKRGEVDRQPLVRMTTATPLRLREQIERPDK